ncbi:MAG: NADH-quinone oxidoreductase subunit K [Deltaproteobacteria bacterium]|nr:NADH-quinone oxidoreductase subunit K [Deltaproteobacteria bacterium]
MNLIIAIMTALLFGAGIYLVLEQKLLKILFGLSLLTHAGNLFILSVSGDPTGKIAPIIKNTAQAPYVDPLPQALILTAIVIGFGVSAYFVVLIFRFFREENETSLEEVFTNNER